MLKPPKSQILAFKAQAEDSINRRMSRALAALATAKPKPQHGGERAGAGRPPIKPGEETTTITIRVTVSQRDKFQAIGGSERFRAWLERVKA